MLSTLLAIALLHWVVLMTPGANVLVVSSLAANGSRASACFAAMAINDLNRSAIFIPQVLRYPLR
jgi:threonine efflux protein